MCHLPVAIDLGRNANNNSSSSNANLVIFQLNYIRHDNNLTEFATHNAPEIVWLYNLYRKVFFYSMPSTYAFDVNNTSIKSVSQLKSY